MLYHSKIPTVNVGDVMCRYYDTGEFEKALVVSVVTRGEDDWQAIVMSRTGFEMVSGSAERRGFNDWRPLTWVYDSTLDVFRPPNTAWSDTQNQFVPKDLGENPSPENVRPGNPSGASAPRIAAELAVLPEILPDDTFETWLRRCQMTHAEVNFALPAVADFVQKRWSERKRKRTVAVPPPPSLG